MLFYFQHRCILCSTECTTHVYTCETCYQELPWVGPHCLLCALPIVLDGDLDGDLDENEPTPASTDQQLICGQCMNQKLPYDTILTPFYYQQPISKLIRFLKFNNRIGTAKVLASLIMPKIKEFYTERPKPEVIIPIPLHDKKLYQRGFNQAIEIGKFLSQSLEIPLDKCSSKRVRNTPAQHFLDKKERKRNLHNAFECHFSQKLSHVAVLDDVMTTGTTMKTFCALLKKQGVNTIDVWCLARTKIKKLN